MLFSLLLAALGISVTPPARADAFTPPPVAEIHDLYFAHPPLETLLGGAYANKPRLFLFCRHERDLPCLFVMKDAFDRPVRLASGQLWTMPALALSGEGLPYNRTGGNTPQGVLRMDGVMPEPPVPQDFGKFRRVILNFVPRSPSEDLLRRALPPASQASSWWHESVVARDVGRGGLRIHGDGGNGSDPRSPYYPLVSSAGCVTVREGKYDGVDYIDERLLLDQLMRAQGLAPVYANETAIRGLLYLVEIDDEHGPVTATDLSRYGIQ